MEPVFDLIKKMNAAEKGYFKKFSSIAKRNGKNVGELIFTAIEKMEAYDEEALKRKFRKEKFVSYLPVAKIQLQEQILNAMVNYHAETTIYQQVDKLYNEAAFLLQKNVTHLYKKYLQKAIALAESCEYFTRLADLLEKEIHDAVQMRPSAEKDRRIEELYERMETANQKTSNLQTYVYLYARQMNLTSQSYQIRDKEIEQKHLAIVQHPVMADESRALSIKAKLYFYHNWFIYYSVFYRETEAYSTAVKMLQLCESSSIYTEHEPYPYLTAYLYTINGAYRTGDLQSMGKYIAQLGKLQFKIEAANTVRNMYYFKNALFYFSEIKNENRFLTLAEEAAVVLREMGRQFRRDYILVIINHAALGLMKFGRYDKAIEWLELYRNNHRYPIRYDIQVCMLFHLLAAHYETDNYELVNNLIVPVYRFIVKTGQQSAFEKLALRTIRRISNFQNVREHKTALERMKAELDAMMKSDVIDRNKDLYIFLNDFIESKLLGKAYHDYLNSREI